jgi:hypothetical protein
MAEIISLLDRKPVTYSVTITHFAESVEIAVANTMDDEKSKMAIAHDLERAARLIREEIRGAR